MRAVMDVAVLNLVAYTTQVHSGRVDLHPVSKVVNVAIPNQCVPGNKRPCRSSARLDPRRPNMMNVRVYNARICAKGCTEKANVGDLDVCNADILAFQC